VYIEYSDTWQLVQCKPITCDWQLVTSGKAVMRSSRLVIQSVHVRDYCNT